MVTDKTTLKDLSVFTSDGSTDLFSLIDGTVTQAGRDALRKHVQHPPDSFETLKKTQEAILFWSKHPDLWADEISNGTLVMLDKFFESADSAAAPPGGFSLLLGSFFQKMFNKQQYFFIQFSLSHLSDFLKGCRRLASILDEHETPPLLHKELSAIKDELQHRLTDEITGITKQASYPQLSRLSYMARREMKGMVHRLIDIYARLDAWQSMASAGTKNSWVFPELLPASPIRFEAKHLYHPLLQQPVSYDITFSENSNFLLLTGANMSGKTTFMRSLGVAALLAHLGMAVPAASLHISFLHGIITNMQVEDNILKGESYFFAEVKRMKHIAEKLLQPQPHLVLMDELFKGTNVHDAYECTKTVVDGLLNHPNHLMVLSTHLYEVAQHFSERTEILFMYFVTQMADDANYHFTYELKNGISDDRIGYRILQKEGVIDLLHKVKK